MIDRIYLHKDFKNKYDEINLDDEKSLIDNIIFRIVKEFPNYKSFDSKIIKFKENKIIRKHVSRKPDRILLFDFVNINKEKCLILWNIIKHDEYDIALENCLKSKKELNLLKVSYYNFSDFNEQDDDKVDEKDLKIQPDLKKMTNYFKFCMDLKYFDEIQNNKIVSLEEYIKQFDTKNNFNGIQFVKDQEKILKAPAPLLLQGSSGTGKTLILLGRLLNVYNYLEEHEKQPSILYLNLYKGVANEIKKFFSEKNKLIENFEYNGLNDFLIEFIDRSDIDENEKKKFKDKDNKIEIENFREEWYKKRKNSFKDITYVLLWEQIRGVIIGKSSKEILSEKEYCATINKRKDLFDINYARKIYKAAESYIQWKNLSGYWDDSDLAWKCLKILKEGKEIKKYSAIAIDEAQDLTEREIDIIIRLCKFYNDKINIFIAGDINQKLNPSAFFWENVKKSLEKLYLEYNESNSNVVFKNNKIFNLKKNFRCKKNIVELGNLFLRKIRNFEKENDLRIYSEEQEAISDDDNDNIYLVNFDSTDEIFSEIEGFEDRSDLVYIFPDIESKNKIHKTLSFSIEEFKGLESNKVVLVGFFKWAKELFNNTKTYYYKNLHILQRFYVAVTRAVNELWLFEEGNILEEFKKEEEQKFLDELDQYIKLSNISIFISKLTNNKEKPEEWEKIAEYYKNRGKIKHAKDCFNKAGILYEKNENFEKAKECYKNAESWDNYIRVCDILTNYFDIAKIYEKYKNDYNNAKKYYLLAERFDFAGRVYEKLGQYNIAAEIYEIISKDYPLALKNYEKSELWDEAIRVALKIEDYKEAAFIYEKKKKDYFNAKKYYEKAEAWDEYANCCKLLNFDFDYAKVYEEKLKDCQKAIDKYKELNLFDEIILLYENRKETDKLFEILFNSENYSYKFISKIIYNKIKSQNDLDKKVEILDKLNYNKELGFIYEFVKNDSKKALKYYYSGKFWYDVLRILDEKKDNEEKSKELRELIENLKEEDQDKYDEFTKIISYYNSELGQDKEKNSNNIDLNLSDEDKNIIEEIEFYKKVNDLLKQIKNNYHSNLNKDFKNILDEYIQYYNKNGNDKFSLIGEIIEYLILPLENNEENKKWIKYYYIKEAGLYEKNLNYEEALKYYEKAEDYDKILRVLELNKINKNYLQAGLIDEFCFENYNSALENYGLANSIVDKIRIYKRDKKYLDVAKIYENDIQDYKKAGIYYELAKNFDKSLEMYEKIKDYEKALDVCIKNNNYQKALYFLEKSQIKKSEYLYAELLEINEKYEDALKIYEETLNDYKKAELLSFNFGKDHDVERLCEKTKDFEYIGLKYELEKQDYQNVQKIYLNGNLINYFIILERQKKYEDAAKGYEVKLNDKEKALELYNKAKNEYEKLEEWEDCIRMCYKTNDHKKAGWIYEEKLKDFDKAKEYYLKANKFIKFFKLCIKTKDYFNLGKIYEYFKIYPKAKEFYKKAGALKDLARVYEKIKEKNKKYE